MRDTIYRPILRVNSETNELYLTKKMLDSIELKSTNMSKKVVSTWSKFLEEYQGVIDFIDIEESETLMIAMYQKYLGKNREKMNNFKTKHKNNIINSRNN